MGKLIIFGCFILSFIFTGCNQEADLGMIEYIPEVCVEGRIESGMPPVVLLTRTASFNHEMDTLTLLKHVIREAKVSVSDGVVTEILRLEMNKNYMPPYIYTGSSLIGEIGKKYQLKIEYQGRIISAETYIPQPVPLESITFVKEQPTDTSGYVHIRFRNSVENGASYQIATMVEGEETVYTPCLFGNIERAMFPGGSIVDIQVNRGPVLYPETHFNTYFVVGDMIRLKFRTLPQDGYDFWNSWQNEVLNAQNPIFPAHSDLKSNINGGIGIWCGYGTYNYRIKAD